MKWIKIKNELWISKKTPKLTPKEQKEILKLMKKNDCDTLIVEVCNPKEIYRWKNNKWVK